MTRIFLHNDTATLTENKAVFGSSGASDKVIINNTALASTVNSNVETIQFTGKFSDYQYAVQGNQLLINYQGSTLATIGIQTDSNGTALAFSDTTTTAQLTGMNKATLGKVTLTTTASSYTNAQLDGTPPIQKAPWTLLMEAGSYYSLDRVFVSDGTAAGTDFVTDTVNANQITTSNDKKSAYLMYQYATDDKRSLSLLTDTTTTPIKLTSTVDYASPIINNYNLANGYTLLTTNSGDSGADAITTDGTAAHTYSLGLNAYQIFQVDTARNAIWYAKSTPEQGLELYYAKGNNVGSIVKDIYLGQNSGINNYYPYNVLLPNGNLIFSAYDGVAGKIWVSDGTEGRTSSLDVNPGSQFTLLGNKAAVSGYYYDGTYYQTELIFTDGTTAGTTALDVYAGHSSSNPTILGTINNLLYFTATDATGLSLFSTNGTTFTKKVSIAYNDVKILGYTDSIAYFAITDATHGQELWAENLTTSTIALVKDILPGSDSAFNRYTFDAQQTLVGNKILFNASISGASKVFFVSDGSEAGTIQLSSSLPIDKAVIGNKVFFTNTQGIYEADLSANSIVASQVAAGNFTTSDTVDHLQSDSNQAFYLTPDNKLKVATSATDSIQLADNVSKFKVVAEDAIYFIETNSNNGSSVSSLWYSDGTTTGTHYIEELGSGGYYYAYYQLENAVAIHTVGVSV